MPHDRFGNLIQAGDKVVIPATVVAVFATENNQYCNCDVELDVPMPPYQEKSRYSALNTQQVEKPSIIPRPLEAGEAAYNGYLRACGGKSLISGAPLPTWEAQSPEIKTAWATAAAEAILFAVDKHKPQQASAYTGAAREMPRYKCHKEVHALKIAAIVTRADKSAIIAPADPGYAPFEVPAPWAERFKGPEEDLGYYVLYDDGFASWSPSKPFEDGYTLIG